MQTRQNRSVLSSMLRRYQRHARAQYLISVDAEPTLAGTRRGAPDARLRSAIPKHAASRASPSGAWRRFDRKALFPRFRRLRRYRADNRQKPACGKFRKVRSAREKQRNSAVQDGLRENPPRPALVVLL